MFVRPRAVIQRALSEQSPEVTLIVPFHRAYSAIQENIPYLMKSVNVDFDLLILADGGSKNELTTTIASLENSLATTTHLCELRVFHVPVPVYETRSEDFLIRQSRTNIVISVQADQKIADPTWVSRMLIAKGLQPEMLFLSGRGIHPFSDAIRDFVDSKTGSVKSGGRFSFLLPSVIRRLKLAGHRPSGDPVTNSGSAATEHGFLESGRLGRLGAKIEDSVIQEPGSSIVLAVGGTVMRGPLMISKDLYLELGGFDTSRFFLGNDDHDLAIRGWREHRYTCGYTPVGVRSDLAQGTSRSPTNLLNRVAGLLYLLQSCYSPKLSGLEIAVIEGVREPPRALRRFKVDDLTDEMSGFSEQANGMK